MDRSKEVTGRFTRRSRTLLLYSRHHIWKMAHISILYLPPGGDAASLPAIATIPVTEVSKIQVSFSLVLGIYITHSPPVTALVPKLIPTVPVQVQLCLSALVHFAVAVANGLRHVIEARPGAAAIRKSARFDMYSIAKADEITRTLLYNWP